MKSKKDMQKVIVALSMAINKKELTGSSDMTEDESSKACAVMDVLLWAMDYPNNFNKFADPVIGMCPIADGEIDRVFDEAIKSYGSRDTDTLCE